MWHKWGYNILVSLDQLLNTLIGGDPDETISSRAGKALRRNRMWAKVLCRFLNLFEKEHCKISIDKSEGEDQVLRR